MQNNHWLDGSPARTTALIYCVAAAFVETLLLLAGADIISTRWLIVMATLTLIIGGLLHSILMLTLRD